MCIFSIPRYLAIPPLNHNFGSKHTHDFIWRPIIDEKIDNSIINLLGLSVITKIKGYLKIGKSINQGNSVLKSFEGLNNLKRLGGSLEVYNNDNLINFDGLENLKSIEGDLIIIENDNLQEINGLKSVVSIKEHLYIKDNNNLLNLDGFNSLRTVGKGVSLHKNIKLNSILGFNKLVDPGDKIQIVKNYKLTSLKGLDNIDIEKIKILQVLGNITLKYCGVDPICIYLDNPNNKATIFDNDKGCKTRQEIIQ